MPTRRSASSLQGKRVVLRPPRPSDAPAFLAHAAKSRPLHRGLVHPPLTRAAYALYLERYRAARDAPRNLAFLVVRTDDNALAGVVNLSEIVRGAFQSAYVGYYGFAGMAGKGYMTEGLALVLDFAFRREGLHRIEANVQPGNARSLALVERIGFVREGYSRRYVKVGGRWRDHVRLALLADDWARRRRTLWKELGALP
jgi:ribosomal-protein-alanine N-acetyltransferase